MIARNFLILYIRATALRASVRGLSCEGEQRSDGASAAPRRDDDDQSVPIAGSAFSSIKLIKKNSTLKPCNRLLYGMCSTHPEIITPGGEASSS